MVTFYEMELLRVRGATTLGLYVWLKLEMVTRRWGPSLGYDDDIVRFSHFSLWHDTGINGPRRKRAVEQLEKLGAIRVLNKPKRASKEQYQYEVQIIDHWWENGYLKAADGEAP